MTIDSIQDALVALQGITAAVADETALERMNAAAASISPRDRIVDGVEAAYASHELLNEAQKEALAGVALFSAEHGWHRDGRGEAMAAFLGDDSKPEPDKMVFEAEEPEPPAE